MATIFEAMALAIQHHQGGRLQAAEQICRQILQTEPNQADALHLLGLIAHQVGKHDIAVGYFEQAIRLKGSAAAFHNNLGGAYGALHRIPEAIACFRRALELMPDHVEVHNNLGNALKDQGKLDEAVACFRRALKLKPDHVEVHNNLGNVLKHQGKLDEAIASYRRALELNGNHVEAHNNLGIALKDQRKPDEAVACFRRALKLNADHAGAHNNLGNALKDQGKLDEAIACYRRALELKPDFAEVHYNLGNALKDQGKLDQVIACHRRALELKPDYVEAHNNLGIALKDQGKLDEAVVCYRRVLELKPDHVEAQNNLGNALKDQGKLDEAVACLRRALNLKSDHVEVHNNLGNALKDQGKLNEAAACYRRALELKPDHVGAHNNLGIALQDQGKLDEAIACFRRALELTPDHVEVRNNLGNAHKDQGTLDEAIACYRRALELKPDYVEAHNNLGIALKDQGKLDEAIDCYRRAMELRPDAAVYHSNLLYSLHYHPDCDACTLAAEHQRWYERHAEPLGKWARPHANDPDPERRLRVGYVSPDFRLHPVGRFLLPLLEAHDRRHVQIFCYASVATPDPWTQQLRRQTDCWRDVFGLTDARLAEVIWEDRIDVLVDLAAHMARNRLLAFARKPAPVQVAYLAYPSSTGLRAIDYRLTDPFLDCTEQPDRLSAEELVWLPETAAVYRPPCEVALAGPLPSLAVGHVTFGCLNNFCKVTPPMLAAWRDLLHAVPGARLLLHAHAGAHRDRVRAYFAAGNVDPTRVEFVGFQPLPSYFSLYQRIDIALDPFPYHGGTTTFDALWMGVPVVSLAGKTSIARLGLGILSNAGLPELVARTFEEYVRIAAELAGDLPRLAALRAGLRARLQQSPLMDAPRFARNMEAAYRAMWRRWCAAQPRTADPGA